MIKSYNHADCAELVTSASNLIFLFATDIKQKFKGKEFSEISYSCDEEEEYTLEVYFDSVTFICMLDLNKQCENIFLMMETLPDLAVFIEYCHRNYSYNELLYGWIVNNRLIRLHSKKREYGLIISPLFPPKLEVPV